MSILGLQTKTKDLMVEEMNSHLDRASNAIEKTLIYNYWNEAVKDEMDDLIKKQIEMRKMKEYLADAVDTHQQENAGIYSGLIGVAYTGRIVNGRSVSYRLLTTGKYEMLLYFDYDPNVLAEDRINPNGKKIVIRDAFSPYFAEVNYVYDETNIVSTGDNFKLKIHFDTAEQAEELKQRVNDGTLVGEKILVSTI